MQCNCHRMKNHVLLLLFLSLLLGTAPAAHAGKFNKVLSVGDAAPAWSELQGIDDKQHSLKELDKAKAVVVVFVGHRCPVASGYEARLVAVANKFQERDVVIVAINSSDDPAERLDKMKERAAKSGFNFSYLHDPTQKTARAYGTLCTPHAFLLDGQRKIAYMGAIDDNNDADSVQRHFLRDAIENVLASQPIKTAETRPRGCPIEYAGE